MRLSFLAMLFILVSRIGGLSGFIAISMYFGASTSNSLDPPYMPGGTLRRWSPQYLRY